MPSVTRVKNRLTIQTRKSSPALPVNSGRTTRCACAPADGPAAPLSMLPPWRRAPPETRPPARIMLQMKRPGDCSPGRSLSYLRFFLSDSGAAAPQPAVAAQHELQVVLIARPLLVLRQLRLLLDPVPAFAFARRDLDGLRRILQEHELILRVLLVAEAVARCGVSRDEPIPVHRQHLLDRVLGFERIEIDHAAAGHRAHRDEV